MTMEARTADESALWLQRLVRRPLLAAAVFSCFLNALILAPAVFMLQVYDRVLTSRSPETLLMLLVGVGIAFALMFAFDHLRSRVQGLIGNLVGDALMPEVARQVLQRMAQHRQAGSNALRDVAALRALFSSQGLMAVFDAPWLVVFVLVIGVAHPLLGLMALFSALFMVGLALANDRLTRGAIEILQRDSATAQRWLEQSLRNAEVAQALGMGSALLARFRDLSADVVALQRPTAQRTVAMAAAARTARQVIQTLMLALGAWLVITQQASPGVMTAATILLGRALAPVEQIVGSWRVLAEGRAAYQRLRMLLADSSAASQPMTLPAPQGALAAQAVALRAPGSDRWLLQGVTLSLAPGESLAVVGPSGAGKSTLARVLVGLWRPTSGSVRLDHADLSQWARDDIGPAIGYVPQDVELFDGTVAENIARMGAVAPDRVVAAARRAQVHEMILGLPQGYDTPVDVQGAIVSPGQRQRIALARALYGEPRLLVLDEPNANLDGAGELALADVLRSLRGDVTVVVVTHRTNLVEHVDQMLVLDGGRPQHAGPVAEVLAKLKSCTASRPGHGSAQVVSIGRMAGSVPEARA